MKNVKNLNIIVSLNHEVSRRVTNSILKSPLKIRGSDEDIYVPQAELTQKVGLNNSHLEIILTEKEYDKLIARYVNIGSFEDWLNLIFKRDMHSLVSLRSSFLEESSNNNLAKIKNTLQKEKKINVIFTIIIDDLEDLLIRRFLSARYQIESKFSNRNLNSFYESKFRIQMIKSIQCMKDIVSLFGMSHVNFIHKSQYTNSKCDKYFSRKLSNLCNTEPSVFNSVKIGEYDMNSIFFNYLKQVIENKNMSIREEISEIKKVLAKYNLQTENPLDQLNEEHLKEIRSNANEMLLISKINSPKKILSIGHENCKTEIEYIENSALLQE
jgi:hypothetical protein